MSGLATLLDRARAAGRAAGAGGTDRERMGAAAVVLTLAALAIHLRRPEPLPERTVELAAEAIARLAALVAAETGMATEPAFDRLVDHCSAADLPALRLDLATARGHVAVAVERTFDLGYAVLDDGIAASAYLLDLASLIAGHVLLGALLAGAVPSEPPLASPPQRVPRAPAAPR